MTVPVWTVEEARALRARDARRRERLHTAFGQRLEGPVRGALSTAARIGGPRVWGASLNAVTRYLNRHRTTAFAGYEPRESDVIVSAYFKAGTNWVMHICHQIAHRGRAEFDHIQDAIPWPDAGEPRYWRNLRDTSSPESPTGYRIVKSHLPADLVPLGSGGKYVVVTRDPLDCAASGYHFISKLFLGPFTPPPDIWLDHFGSERAICGPWYDFTATWWAERHRANVLFLRFEDFKARPAAGIAQIAEFLGVDLSPEDLTRVVESTSFAAMKQLNDRFYPVRQTIWSERGGQIIRKGAVGDGAQLFSAEAIARFRERMSAGLAAADSDFPHYGLSSPRQEDSP